MPKTENNSDLGEKAIFTAEFLALLITSFARAGEGHSQIHLDIANISTVVETLTILSLFVSYLTKDKFKNVSNTFKALTVFGVLATVGCFGAVFVTDPKYIEMAKPENQNIDGVRHLLTDVLLPDMEHHTKTVVDFFATR